MAKKSKQVSMWHCIVLEHYANMLKSKNLTVLADNLQGFDQPQEIDGRIPDIVILSDGSDSIKSIIEIETCISIRHDSIFTEETANQWLTIHKKACEVKADFKIVYPKECGDIDTKRVLIQRLKSIGIDPDEVIMESV